MNETIIDFFCGDFGTVLSLVGVPILILGIVEIAIGFSSMDNSRKYKGVFLCAGAAILIAVKSVITFIYS